MNSNRGEPRARSLRLAVALAGALLAPPVLGQTPVAPAAPADPVVVPKPDCGAKPEHPGRLASDTRQRQWRKDAAAYLECFKKYAIDQRARAQQYQDAANALIDDYNSAAREMQAAADAAAQ